MPVCRDTCWQGISEDTHLENWYKKLGYETVLKWNSDGIVMVKQHEE